MAKKNYSYVTVQALSAEPGHTKGGKEQYIVRLKVVAGAAEHIGRELTEYMSLSGKAAGFTAKKLKALGWKGLSPTDMTGIGDVRAEAGIYMDTWEGRTSEKISVFEPRAGLDEAAKKTFGASFKAEIAGMKAIEVTDANRAIARDALPEQQAPSAEDMSEDLPF